MPTLFHLDASIREDDSVTRRLGSAFVETWRGAVPGGTVVHRDLASDPVPHVTKSDLAASMTPLEARSAPKNARIARSDALVGEVLGADVLLLGVPLYNFGLPSGVKAWIDHLFLGPALTGNHGADPLPLAGRPAVVLAARGGAYGPGTPREGWDYAEPYLRRVLGESFGLDVTVIAAELTLARVNPALAHLTDLADQSLERALEQSAAQARRLAGAVAA